MPLEVSAAESSRQLIEQLRTQRLERIRLERSEFEQQRLDELRTQNASSNRELAEQAAAEAVANDRPQANRIEDTGPQTDGVRADDVLAERQSDRFLAERARVEGSQAYASQTPRVDSYAQLDVQQAQRIQATRDSIERADATRIDRVQLSDQALTQVQFA